MTASPFSRNYDTPSPVNPFDVLRPTSRQFTSGSFPVKTFQAQNGAEIRMLYGQQLTGKKMTLTYANISDNDAYYFFQHYVEMRGSYKTFQLGDGEGDGARSGWKGDNAGIGAEGWNMIWRYASEPQIQSVFNGRSTVTVELIAVPKP